MKVSECMTRDVRTIAPDQTLCDAAKMMCELDAGCLPVGENDRLIGMITDRDIAVRGVAANKGPDCPVRDVMTREVKYCFEDEEVAHVADSMGDLQVRRLPVLSRDKRLVGIVSLGDLASSRERPEMVGEALEDISRQGGKHSQRPGDVLH